MIERKPRSFDEHYDNLSDEQLLTIYRYRKVGYGLAFVRDAETKPLAVLQCNDTMISVDEDGKVGSMKGIQLRN